MGNSVTWFLRNADRIQEKNVFDSEERTSRRRLAPVCQHKRGTALAVLYNAGKKAQLTHRDYASALSVQLEILSTAAQP